MSRSLAALIAGAVGTLALVGIGIIFIYFCIFRKRNIPSNTSENGSSDTSVQVSHDRSIEILLTGHTPLASDSQEARHFRLEELDLATKNFNEKNLIGEGRFGLVYKGLLHDGTVVAIKRRHAPPKQKFIDEVRQLCSIRHRNLVSLLGCCQERGQQMLIYEYIPNGSVSRHLYEQHPQTKLEFKHRLLIALGAARGLDHLHAMNPPMVHKDFKTHNVLVDENFIAKVADFGVSDMLERVNDAGPSQMMGVDTFMDPEVRKLGRLSDKSDVYSFGVFLLELLSGREAVKPQFPNNGPSLVQMAKTCLESEDITSIIDPGMGESFTAEGIKEMINLAIICVYPSRERRPMMHDVMAELDRILEKEMSLTTIMGHAD
ncbi:putative serine/threonine-protein kinase isoform X6 [Amborella trichopoda]|uniref:putative serine/threonine-protein kinase isoform X6 n=1 Tax=Amborella trichopoda TaxID=13333 RepID=UPI0009BF3277|nr:putative serine/threonine-protein kinase isoform X6 [Amborella trichopoda]|eukprot:XP_020523000.1 putative serine/threonine-protein kinase isoform X6 [Amborella trichopoda]